MNEILKRKELQEKILKLNRNANFFFVYFAWRDEKGFRFPNPNVTLDKSKFDIKELEELHQSLELVVEHLQSIFEVADCSETAVSNRLHGDFLDPELYDIKEISKAH